jgi:hypothetical protein
MAGGGFEEPFNSGRGFLASFEGEEWKQVIDKAWSRDDAYYADFGPLHVWALGARGNELQIAGNFNSVGGSPNYGFAIWHEGPLPLVEATFQNRELFLTWPKEFNDAHLESSPSLQNDEWQESDLPRSASDDHIQVGVAPANIQRFYRLRLN